MPLEAEVWQRALAEWGTEGLSDRLRQANQAFQWRPGDAYTLLPSELGVDVQTILRGVPELSQLPLNDRLLLPARLWRHLVNGLLQALPIEQLPSALQERRLQADLGL